MTPPPYLYHALLRPSILQILRAAGYHGARTSVLDSVTDMAARYLDALCRLTATFAAHNNEEPETGELVPTIVDVRMALQQIGALLPEKSELEQLYNGVEDTRGVDAFVAWAAGPVNKEIKRIALDSDEATDYLNALKLKHSKNDDDSRYTGSLLGKCIEHGNVEVEGGKYHSIALWEEKMKEAARRPPSQPQPQEEDKPEGINGDREDSRPPSSGLSSIGDQSIADPMDLE
ncbi:hypothetical protein B0T13DRAFT_254359 [Neurospora crassa]|nr:hypothetical protein B0T13DRAFT_254359 [Neurospora crassa]